ncbi:MAG: hypothetical protein FWE97_03110 [Dehalococcoidia bacterium]|nr:hypothetical protein [Dehalococcoidia bacterium]
MGAYVLTKNWILSRIIPLLLITSLVIGGILAGNTPVNAANGVWEGNGTSNSPFLISDLADLTKLATDVNSGKSYLDTFFKLTADIDLAGFSIASGGWRPIGNENNPFAGTFDGNNHVVKNISINRPSVDDIGLFGCLSRGEIRNLGVQGTTIRGNFGVGGLVGTVYSSTIDNCYYIGSVQGSVFVGGLVGYSESSTIKNSYHKPSADLNTSVVDGLMAIGGIVGYSAGGTVENCYNTSGVNSNDIAGGVAGFNYNGRIENCYNTGMVSGSSMVGGVIGISTDFFDDSIFVLGFPSVENCYNTGAVLGTAYVGGIVGNNITGPVENCYNTGAVSGTIVAGGIAGAASGQVRNCYNTGSVAGYSMIGGVAGISDGAITNCFNSGAITGIESSGGVIGINLGTIESCYNIGAVSGTYTIGGIAGGNYVDSAIKNSYNIGAISGTVDVGGVVGDNFFGTVTNCYYNNEIYKGDGIGTGAAGTATGKSTAEMTARGFEITLGTAFEKRATDTDNCYYPELRALNTNGNAVSQAASKASTTVARRTPVDIITPISSAITYGQTLSASSLGNSSAKCTVTGITINGTCEWTNGTSINPAVSDSNTTDYAFTFTPTTYPDLYKPATGTAKVTVNKANLTVAANDSSKNYFEDNPTFTISYSGFVNGDTVSSITITPQATSEADKYSPAGNYPLTVSGGTANNYIFVYVSGTLTVNKIALTVTADDQSKSYNKNNPILTYQYSGFVNGEDESVLTEKPSISTEAEKKSPVGTYLITASGGLADNYTFKYVSGTLTVNKAFPLIPLLIGIAAGLLVIIAMVLLIKRRRKRVKSEPSPSSLTNDNSQSNLTEDDTQQSQTDDNTSSLTEDNNQ